MSLVVRVVRHPAPRAEGEVQRPAGGLGGHLFANNIYPGTMVCVNLLKKVILTRSFYPLVDLVPAVLECHAICKGTRTK